MPEQEVDRSLWKGFVTGMVGGLVASWTMNQFQKAWSSAADNLSNGKHSSRSNEGEDPTAITADRISYATSGKRLTKAKKQKAAPAVHYAFGALMGGLYGAVVEIRPEVNMMKGIPYGTALFIGADEVMLPALGLSKAPTSYPLSRHAFGMASHFVYGVTVESVRRALRKYI